MTENKRNIDDFFREGFDNAIDTPPSSVWETLEKRLDERKTSRRRYWWVYLLLLSMFIGGSIAAYLSTRQSGQSSNTTASTNTLQPTIIQNHSSTEENSQEENEEINPTKENIPGNTRNIEKNQEENIEKNTKNQAPSLSGKNESASRSITPINNKKDKNGDNEKVVAAPSPGKTSANSIEKRTERETRAENTIKKERGSDINNNKTSAGNSNQAKKNKEDLEESINTDTKASKNNQKSQNQKNTTKNYTANKLSNTNAPPEKQETNTLNNTSASAKTNGNKLMTDNAVKNTAGIKPSTGTTDAKPEREERKKTEVKPENRGLSGIPDGFEEEYDDEASNIVDTYNSQPESSSNEISTAAERKATIENKIQKNRASNPLSGAPLAANVLNEDDTKGNPDAQTEASGGGVSAVAPRDKIKRSLNMTIGIKAGFEQGFASYTSSKFVGSAFGEVNFSKKISFIIQPGIKLGNTNREYGSVLGSFIDAGPTSRNEYNIRKDTTGKPTGFSDFAFEQNYDSIVASIVAERRFVEVEVPFLFRYKVDNSFSILAGMNFTFGKIISSNTSINRMNGLNLKDTIYNFSTTDSAAPVPSAPGQFSHTGTPAFSTYKDPGSNSISPFRFGYSVGFTYTYKQRLMLDVMIQQNLSGLSNITDTEIRKIFSQPYIRLSLGCIIFGSKKQ